MNRTVGLAQQMSAAAVRIIDMQRGLMAEAQADAEAAAAQNRWVITASFVLSLALTIIVLAVVRGITSRLQALASEMDSGAEQVAAAAGQVATSSQTLSHGATRQAAALEETAATNHRDQCHGAPER